MLAFKIITSDEQLRHYRQNYYKSLKGEVDEKSNSVALEFLKKCQVVGVFDARGIMVAGYTLGTLLPLRLPSYVPGGDCAMNLPKNHRWDNYCEIVCVWKQSSVSKLIMGSEIWPKIMSDVMATGKKYLLGHNQSRGLNKRYTFLSPQTLYQGPSTKSIPSHLFRYTRLQMRTIRFFAKNIYPSIYPLIKRPVRKQEQFDGR